MAIISSPLSIQAPRLPGSQAATKTDPFVLRLWQSCFDVAAAVGAMLSLFEWHQDETIDSSGTPVRHNLRRRPYGRVILRQDGNRVIYDDYQLWTSTEVVLKVGAGSVTATFVLF